MTRDGELLPREILRERPAVTDDRMTRLVAEGSRFSIEIDGALTSISTVCFRKVAKVVRLWNGWKSH